MFEEKRSAKNRIGGEKEVKLGNNIFSDHKDKDMVIYQVSEDGPTRICDKKSLLCGNVE